MRAKTIAIARILLDAGADVNAVTVPNRTGRRAGQTALMQASAEGNLEIAALLLQHGATTDQRDEQGCNALMLAAWGRNPDLIRLLYWPQVQSWAWLKPPFWVMEP